jgi:hypothetical protein
MNRKSSRRSHLRRARRALGSGLILAALGLAGCGRPSEVRDLPEPARQSLVRKKVDFPPRSASPPRQAAGPSRAAATGRRP